VLDVDADAGDIAADAADALCYLVATKGLIVAKLKLHGL
jgi:hypothetical protein